MAFDFIFGSDEYLVEEAARARWAELSSGLDKEFGTEIIDGRCLKVEEVETLVKRAREGVQTVGLFGGGRAVWIKSVNFITDSVVGRSETTLEALESLKPILESANPAETKILISATPIDKRLSFFKWLSSKGESKEIPGLEGIDAAKLGRLGAEKGVSFENAAAELFLQKVGTNARAVIAELEKLSLYLGGTTEAPKKAKAADILEITSDLAEEEFFEPIEAFYSRDPKWALESISRYFSTRKDNDVRPIIVALFNRNRLLMMIRAAEEEGMARVKPGGLSWAPAATELKEKFGAEKSPFNIFAQNPWYLGKLAAEAKRFTFDELSFIQRDLFDLFESMHFQDQATVFEGFFVKYVTPRGE